MNHKTGEPNMDAGNHIPEFESSGSSPGQPDTGAANSKVISPGEKKKRGRPRKYANNAEKTAASRLRKKDKQQNADRRVLVAELIRQCKAMLSSPSKEISQSSAHTIRAKNAHYLREFEKNLFALPVDKLRQLKDIREQTPNSYGRLHNERSGDAGRQNGLSEIERIQQKFGERDFVLTAASSARPENAIVSLAARSSIPRSKV